PTHVIGYGNAGSAAGPAPAVAFPNQMRSLGKSPGANVPPTATRVDPIAIAPDGSSVASELPGIRIVTAGPRQIMIRQTHAYEIRAENRGSIDANGLVVRAHIPDWADVVGQQASVGRVVADTEAGTRHLVWKLDHLAAGEMQRMFVRLKAARSGTHDLDVDWTLAPQKDRVQVVVSEPELAITIDGPDEVVYGESKTYTIRVLNPGDGIAPQVVFTLSPNSSTPQTQRIGDIPAGKEAQFEVELTAQDLGELKIHGLAVGELELKAEADKTVRVLAADLEAVLTGPEMKYQNAEAMYQLELANHGTAASQNVMATLNLPMGVEYLGGMEGASLTGHQLRWKVASLTPDAVRQYQFRVRMNETGHQEFAFDCKGSAAGQTDVSLATDVEAIDDLVLSIEDPAAPAPIGKEVLYQIVIRNRGSKPATNVRAIAQFSHGIEPVAIRGHEGKVITGQVLIEPVPRIDAGAEVRMTIVAKAEKGGHHRFRTEIRSGDTTLVAEEATQYLSPRNDRISRRSNSGGNEFALPLR
ncbi:MAG: CARDB domain-containing protein, partial [Planctomycetota bacterium]